MKRKGRKVEVNEVLDIIEKRGKVMVGMLPCNMNPEDEKNFIDWRTVVSFQHFLMEVKDVEKEECNEVRGKYLNYYLE